VPCPAAIDAGVAEAIVPRTFLAIVKDFERFAAFLEALDRLLIARILVGVIFNGELAIGSGHVCSRRAAFDAEDFVITAFGHSRRQ
jgi:hypothetical protein